MPTSLPPENSDQTVRPWRRENALGAASTFRSGHLNRVLLKFNCFYQNDTFYSAVAKRVAADAVARCDWQRMILLARNAKPKVKNRVEAETPFHKPLAMLFRATSETTASRISEPLDFASTFFAALQFCFYEITYAKRPPLPHILVVVSRRKSSRGGLRRVILARRKKRVRRKKTARRILFY